MSTKRFFRKTKKNKSDIEKKNQSPSNSRTIPAFSSANFLKIYHGSLNIFTISIFIVAVIIVGLDLNANLKAKQNIDFQRSILTKDLNFWKSFIVKNNDYRDAYLQASILEYNLGDTSRAKIYVEKGLALDPNSENGKKIEEFLNK